MEEAKTEGRQHDTMVAHGATVYVIRLSSIPPDIRRTTDELSGGLIIKNVYLSFINPRKVLVLSFAQSSFSNYVETAAEVID